MIIQFKDILLFDWRIDNAKIIRCACNDLQAFRKCNGFIAIDSYANKRYITFGSSFGKTILPIYNTFFQNQKFDTKDLAKQHIDDFLLNFDRYEKLYNFH